MPHDIADDEQGGILRPLGDEIEIAADPLGVSGQKGGGQLQARAHRQLGRRERIADRAQILELVLRCVEALAQACELLIAHRGFAPKPRDQRLLAVPLCGFMAHDSYGASRVPSRGQRIVSYGALGVHPRAPRAP